MDTFDRILRKIIIYGNGLGGAFLVAMMLVVVATVATRLVRVTFAGSYEMVEVFVVVTVAFAMPYTALQKGHVVIDFLTSRLKVKTQLILSIISTILAMVIWGAITWAQVLIMQEKWISEVSFLIKIPYLPFRIVWVIGLCLFTLVYFSNVIQTIKKLGGKA